MMKTEEKYFNFLYNKLVEISNGNVQTIHYLFGPKWKVCKFDDTVKIAKDAIKVVELYSNDIINFEFDQSKYLKVSKMFDTLIKISKAKIDSWDDGWFDTVYFYYADDTVYEAQKCINKDN